MSKNTPKMAKNGQKWPKTPQTPKNPKRANGFYGTGLIGFLFIIKTLQAPEGWLRGPPGFAKTPKNGQKWSKMAKNTKLHPKKQCSPTRIVLVKVRFCGISRD